MKTLDVRILNKTKGTVLASRLSFALKHNERRKGLIGSSGLQFGEAFVFTGCRQIHTFGVPFPIDVVFVDGKGVISRAYRNLAPGRVTGIMLRSSTAIELKAGALQAAGTGPGDMLELGGHDWGFSFKNTLTLLTK